jgi:hypothetical protein
MILTDEEKEQAKTLGLTYTELTVALRTHIAPETYARHKADLLRERAAWDAKMEELASAVTERLPPERRPGAVVSPPESE